jgi:hypothetical protein
MPAISVATLCGYNRRESGLMNDFETHPIGTAKELERLRAVYEAADKVIEDECNYENGVTYSMIELAEAVASAQAGKKKDE